ncbi:MAG: hypothetical protein NZL91_04975 [Thermoflexales bacterium]|nr:hypothetical protein [Thermoflexales bacterium]MCS7324501.1 hypothetical protein [Thermoflexales bacterium]MCX7938216.1 hypothetical protein [Thermoflexales bacterium]MDW8054242.1 hypothetical protein [Anaerolineae bacterium]MDW8292238.1 hypothetical protein [Anaerolineae bacterium]
MGLLLLTVGVYAATSMLGTSIRLGWVSTRGWRWVHHALFASIWLALGVTLLWAFNAQVAWRWGLLGAVPFLVFLPRFRAGSSAHCWTATAGFLPLVATLAWALAGAIRVAQ